MRYKINTARKNFIIRKNLEKKSYLSLIGFLLPILYSNAYYIDMDIMGYTVLDEETLPSFLKGRPQIVICMTFAAALLIVTALSIIVGIFIGYTYCYIEHRSGVVKANLSRTNVQIVQIPVNELKNWTVHDALVNNNFVSKVSKYFREELWTEKKSQELPAEATI